MRHEDCREWQEHYKYVCELGKREGLVSLEMIDVLEEAELGDSDLCNNCEKQKECFPED